MLVALFSSITYYYHTGGTFLELAVMDEKPLCVNGMRGEMNVEEGKYRMTVRLGGQPSSHSNGSEAMKLDQWAYSIKAVKEVAASKDLLIISLARSSIESGGIADFRIQQH